MEYSSVCYKKLLWKCKKSNSFGIDYREPKSNPRLCTISYCHVPSCTFNQLHRLEPAFVIRQFIFLPKINLQWNFFWKWVGETVKKWNCFVFMRESFQNDALINFGVWLFIINNLNFKLENKTNLNKRSLKMSFSESLGCISLKERNLKFDRCQECKQ